VCSSDLTTDDGYELRCEVTAFDRVLHALDHANIRTESEELAYIPATTIPVSDVGLAKSLQHLHDALDELDDVQSVYSNEEIDEATAAAVGG
jgi:transcriptional/translational regulatory protein YebC/TACO1